MQPKPETVTQPEHKVESMANYNKDYKTQMEYEIETETEQEIFTKSENWTEIEVMKVVERQFKNELRSL